MHVSIEFDEIKTLFLSIAPLILINIKIIKKERNIATSPCGFNNNFGQFLSIQLVASLLIIWNELSYLLLGDLSYSMGLVISFKLFTVMSCLGPNFHPT